MLSRALILATVMLSILFAAPDLRAQNLDAGKSPGQIFSSSCSVCHRSPRGLLKTVPPGALPGFLRDHYTTGKDMAQQLSGFLLGNGATDPRSAGSRLTKQGEEARSGRQSEPQPADAQPPGRRLRPGQPQEAARPDGPNQDADGLATADPRAARKRARQERLERQQQEQQAARGPDGQPVPNESALTKRQKQKMGKKKGREEPMPATAQTPAPAESVRPNASRPEAGPAEMPKPPEPAPVVIDPQIDAPKPEPAKTAEPASPRADPVPQVTPAPSAPIPAAPSETPAAPSDAPPQRPTISVTPPPPSPPSGPAAAPISQ